MKLSFKVSFTFINPFLTTKTQFREGLLKTTATEKMDENAFVNFLNCITQFLILS